MEQNIYPILPYTTLNLKSDYFTEFLPVIKEIATIAKGGYKLKAEDYLLIRDSEDGEIRKKRIEKFAPKNYLGAALKLQRTKQASGDLNLDLTSLPGIQDDWNSFLEDVDRKGTSYKDFVLNIFESGLINKIAYVQIELPYIGLSNEKLNLAQVEEIKKRIKPIPNLVQIDPQNILSESESVKGCNLNWIKYKRIDAIESPFNPTKYNLEFILIDTQYITIWRFYDVILDENKDIVKIFDSSLDGDVGAYRNFVPKDDIAIPVSILHNRDSCPVLKFKLEDSLWMANEVYRVQKIIFGLCMSLLHTSCNAGFIQKWGKPYSVNNGGVGGASFSPVTKSALVEINKNIKVSDETTLWLDFFAFEEMQGTSITIQQAVIDDLKNYIFATIAFNQTLVEPSTSSTPASGIAKQMDNYLQNTTLQSHGGKIINFSKDLLQAVAIAFGVKQQPLLDQISVSGMDKFTFEPINEHLDTVERLNALPNDLIPEELMIESLLKVANSMLTNHSYNQKSDILGAINKKVSNFYSTPDSPIPNVDPVAMQQDHLVSTSNDAAIAIQ